MNQIIFLLLLIVLAIGLPLVFNITHFLEGYSNFSLDQSSSSFPDSQSQVLLQDTFPTIGKNQISNYDSSKIWWHYRSLHMKFCAVNCLEMKKRPN